MDLLSIVFYVFAGVLLLSGLRVITAKNPVHAVLFLILAFFNAAGLMVLMGAEFIAMILVIVYVGAVAVLFLFVVMMLDINFEALRKGMKKSLPLAFMMGIFICAQFYIMIKARDNMDGLASPQTEAAQAIRYESLNAMYVSPSAEGEIAIKQNNTKDLGRVLYTYYVVPFQVSGLILLVAMIGAIVLTLRSRSGVRRQKIQSQVMRRREDVLKIEKISSGSGVS